jgi:hypothetical protein
MSQRQRLGLSVFILLIEATLRFYKVSTTGILQERLEDIAGPGNHVPLYFLSEEILPH